MLKQVINIITIMPEGLINWHENLVSRVFPQGETRSLSNARWRAVRKEVYKLHALNWFNQIFSQMIHHCITSHNTLFTATFSYLFYLLLVLGCQFCHSNGYLVLCCLAVPHGGACSICYSWAGWLTEHKLRLSDQIYTQQFLFLYYLGTTVHCNINISVYYYLSIAVFYLHFQGKIR
jgi:hypothetical protein